MYCIEPCVRPVTFCLFLGPCFRDWKIRTAKTFFTCADKIHHPTDVGVPLLPQFIRRRNLFLLNVQPAFQVLIANFERVYPNIVVDATYAAQASTLNQLELTELAAGNAPDLLSTSLGCGSPLAVWTAR